ncbi:hypothetical protein DIPPA_02116 [Diplonema papillatum]|nr:hypothetical protein DIPPA_02116 [Diplonema papillatum]
MKQTGVGVEGCDEVMREVLQVMESLVEQQRETKREVEEMRCRALEAEKVAEQLQSATKRLATCGVNAVQTLGDALNTARAASRGGGGTEIEACNRRLLLEVVRLKRLLSASQAEASVSQRDLPVAPTDAPHDTRLQEALREQAARLEADLADSKAQCAKAEQQVRALERENGLLASKTAAPSNEDFALLRVENEKLQRDVDDQRSKRHQLKQQLLRMRQQAQLAAAAEAKGSVENDPFAPPRRRVSGEPGGGAAATPDSRQPAEAASPGAEGKRPREDVANDPFASPRKRVSREAVDLADRRL